MKDNTEALKIKPTSDDIVGEPELSTIESVGCRLAAIRGTTNIRNTPDRVNKLDMTAESVARLSRSVIDERRAK